MRRYDAIRPHLTERQRRVWLGSEARELGSGGVDGRGRGAGLARHGAAWTQRARRSRTTTGGPLAWSWRGRKRAEEHDPALPAALDALVDPDSRGDPMTPLRWTSKSLRSLADQLRAQGHRVSATLVARLLHEAGYSLQANSKTLEGAQHPDRDAQFRHIHDTVAAALGAGTPVVSVDARRRNSSASTRTTARTTVPPGDPERVEVHDFIGAAGKAIPYGVYDLGANTGWVSVASAPPRQRCLSPSQHGSATKSFGNNGATAEKNALEQSP